VRAVVREGVFALRNASVVRGFEIRAACLGCLGSLHRVSDQVAGEQDRAALGAASDGCQESSSGKESGAAHAQSALRVKTAAQLLRDLQRINAAFQLTGCRCELRLKRFDLAASVTDQV
jgi:hypothetical protein